MKLPKELKPYEKGLKMMEAYLERIKNGNSCESQLIKMVNAKTNEVTEYK